MRLHAKKEIMNFNASSQSKSVGALKIIMSSGFVCKSPLLLYTRYPIVARALGLAFRPSARASKGILHTTFARARTRNIVNVNIAVIDY